MKNTTETTYDLSALETDSWVEAISALETDLLDEALDRADDETIVRWARNSRCPAELESELTALADKYHYTFNADGEVVYSDYEFAAVNNR